MKQQMAQFFRDEIKDIVESLRAQGVEREQIIGPPFMAPPAPWVLEECREPGETDEMVIARINSYLATIWRCSLN